MYESIFKCLVSKNGCNVSSVVQYTSHSANVGGLAMFINHPCDPNCKLERWEVSRLPRMCFFAIKKIKEGDELTFDYNGCVIKTKERQNLSAGQQIVVGLLKNLKHAKKVRWRIRLQLEV